MRLALLGWPVAHSRSPAMHRAALEALGIDGVYEAVPVPPGGLAEALRALRATGIDGFNVTVPHKRAIASHLDATEPVATRIGAVNTVLRVGNAWMGTNTDAEGFVRGLREGGFDPKAPALILGAGGAARAVAAGLVNAGANVEVAARRDAQARGLTELGATAIPWADLETAFARARLVVQATSATLSEETAVPFVQELPWDALQRPACVDLVYDPSPSFFLQRAAAVGCDIQDGFPMLLHQGAIAFERWTSLPAPLSAMRAALHPRGAK